MSNRISKHQPHFERDIFEFQEIARVEDLELNSAKGQFSKVMNNQFILTADSDGLSMAEKLYGIVPDPSDTLDFRRERILTRIQLQPPFTEKFLRLQLDKIIGVGKYTLDIDYDNYKMTISSAAMNQAYAQEVSIIVNKVKPANIIFISSPLVMEGIFESEIIENIPLELNYRLGTRWNLGRKPFKSRGLGEVIKMPEVKSIQNSLLNESAVFINSIINKIIVNEDVEINEFTAKNVSENVVELEYNISNEMGVNAVNRLRVCKEDGTVLTDINVYVPVIGETLINHKISVKEGV